MTQQPNPYRDMKAEAKAQKAYAKAQRPFYKKKRFIIPAAILVLVGIGSAASGGDSGTEEPPLAAESEPREPKAKPQAVAEGSKPKAETKPETKAEAKPDKPDGAVESVSQANARMKTEEYLGLSAFSREGLIDQLKFEGFSVEDATYGVDAVNPDWNEQAAAKAAEYLSLQSFSRQGLIDQLIFEDFTPAQAEYGVNQTGL